FGWSSLAGWKCAYFSTFCAWAGAAASASNAQADAANSERIILIVVSFICVPAATLAGVSEPRRHRRAELRDQHDGEQHEQLRREQRQHCISQAVELQAADRRHHEQHR